MKLDEWLRWYEWIVEYLNLDRDKDREAATLLSRLICNKRIVSVENLKWELRKFRYVIIFGAGPSLKQDISLAKPILSRDGACVVACDGAAKALLEQGVRPFLVVTDLDGDADTLLSCSSRGVIMAVHAHGDNMDKLSLIVPKLNGPLIGSSQVEPTACLVNFGGFTDGDRAVLLCEHLGCKCIILGGMDFGNEVGEYSKPFRVEGGLLSRKLKKLEIGRRILEWLAQTSGAELIDATSGSEGIRGFKRLSWSELEKRLS
ncbi:MAG: DUF115 domain-containing protein [Aigarchaeota archaeon]|nr:DUF115 domain-containing protein [Candidatus Pelearchaeum maunauluense]